MKTEDPLEQSMQEEQAVRFRGQQASCAFGIGLVPRSPLHFGQLPDRPLELSRWRGGRGCVVVEAGVVAVS